MELLEEMLDRHNKYRCKADVPLLQWDDAAATFAQEHANKGKFEHSRRENRIVNGEQCGENIAWGMPTYSGVQSTDAWYNEITETGSEGDTGYGLVGGSPASPRGTGHYTQVVWKDSTKLGCGTAKSDGGDLWVCVYCPAGNFGGMYDSNVLAPTKSDAECSDSDRVDIADGASPTPPPTPPAEKEATDDADEDVDDSPVCEDAIPTMYCEMYKDHCRPCVRINGMPMFEACKKTCEQCPATSTGAGPAPPPPCTDKMCSSVCNMFKNPWCDRTLGGYIAGQPFPDQCQRTCGQC
jgi:hypothetical protein